jgi:hypothetical protein
VRQADIDGEVRQRFRELVVQTRRPGAFSGRPTLADNSNSHPNTNPDPPVIRR